MSQISPPIRIVIVLAVAVMGVYMFFMRPKDEVVPAATAPVATGAVSQPGKVGEAAQDAVTAANGQLAQQESVDGVDAGEAAATAAGTANAAPGSPAATTNAATDLKGLPKPIAKAIRKDKFLVLLFWNGRSVDDLAVRDALRKADRWNGRVHVEVASIKSISSYGRIARGVDVEQSPTVVIADPQLRADTLVGYVDTTTINQAVVDSMRNSTGLFTDTYLRAVDRVCRRHSNSVATIPTYEGSGSVRRADTRLAAVDRSHTRFVADFKAVEAPKRWRAFRAASAADLTAFGAAIGRFSSAVTPAATVGSVVATSGRFERSAKPVAKRADRRFDAQGLFRCGSQF